MPDLIQLLDLADVAVARSEGVLDGEDRRSIAHIARRVRRRTGFLGEYLVVALAGGTGSGKSSLLNALVSAQVVDVGVVRPTTSAAVAVIPQDGDVDLSALIADLSIEKVVRSEHVASTVFVDLPDFDSIEAAHRHIVERVLPRVDAVVWVFHPEKYADPSVHREFLQQLVAYRDQFIFVLNHRDRLGSHAATVATSLKVLLERDGYLGAEVVCTVASGSLDVAHLEDALSGRFDLKATALTKAALDLRSVAQDAWKACREAVRCAVDDEAADRAALTAATFVSLGVEAYAFHQSIARDHRG